MDKAASLDPAPGVDVCNLDDRESRREERRLRHWVIKVFVFTWAFIFTLVVGSMLWAFVVRGDAIDGTIIDTFLKATTEVIRILAS